MKGIEANIRVDGTVDMEPHELGRLEVVVAAPHSALRTDADQTARLLGAVSTPGVNILGHPRGRMYGSRPGVSADWPAVFAAAARTNVAIEIDGDPARQDIDYLLARDAVKSGCLFALDSDAHDTPEFAYAETAIARARATRRRAGESRRQLLDARAPPRLGQRCMAPLKTAMPCGPASRNSPAGEAGPTRSLGSRGDSLSKIPVNPGVLQPVTGLRPRSQGPSIE